MLFIYKIQFKLFQRKQGQKQQGKGNLYKSICSFVCSCIHRN